MGKKRTFAPVKLNANLEQSPVFEWLQSKHFLQTYRHVRALWLTLVSAVLLTGVMVLGAWEPRSGSLQPDFHTALIFVCNLLLFLPLYMYSFALARRNLSPARLVVLGLLGSLLIATLISSGFYMLESAVYGEEHTSNPYFVTIIVGFAAALTAFFITILLNNVSAYQQQVAENEHLHAENLRVRYDALEQQMDPHFLFNSLNTLDGLIGSDDAQAHQYLHSLSDSFRYVLQREHETTLEEELRFTRSYVEMMTIRFGDALHVEEQIDESLMGCRVVPISIQLAVENAIKHNVVSQRHPLVISIVASGAERTIRVSNPLQPKAADAGGSSGVGLSNLSQRCRMQLDRDIVVVDDGKTFTLEIPML